MAAAERFAVLFVDDESLVLQGLRRVLRAEGRAWKIGFAASGREALGLFARESFDCVVTDLRMPGMDGIELLGQVMSRHPQAARIILSGELDAERTLSAARVAHQFLPKPCGPEALRSMLSRLCRARRLIAGTRLGSLLPRLQTLPSLPGIYAGILAEVRSPHASIRRVARMVGRDIAMSAKVLQLVNSAFFGLPRRVVSAEEAVALLGLETVKALALTAGIFDQFDPARIRGVDLQPLWDHSLETGLTARTIARFEGLGAPVEEAAFTAGVLHDLGKLILAQNLPIEYAGIIARVPPGATCAWEAEQAVFGSSHAEVGAYLIGLWGLAEEVVAAVAGHHRSPAAPGAAGGLPALLRAADFLAHRLATAATAPAGPEAAPAPPGIFGAGAERLSEWERVCREVRSKEMNRVG